jgi:hypothetical protein
VCAIVMINGSVLVDIREQHCACCRTKSKLTEPKDELARAAKAEKDKKDAMANIDINNYASMYQDRNYLQSN